LLKRYLAIRAILSAAPVRLLLIPSVVLCEAASAGRAARNRTYHLALPTRVENTEQEKAA